MTRINGALAMALKRGGSGKGEKLSSVVPSDLGEEWERDVCCHRKKWFLRYYPPTPALWLDTTWEVAAGRLHSFSRLLGMGSEQGLMGVETAKWACVSTRRPGGEIFWRVLDARAIARLLPLTCKPEAPSMKIYYWCVTKTACHRHFLALLITWVPRTGDVSFLSTRHW